MLEDKRWMNADDSHTQMKRRIKVINKMNNKRKAVKMQKMKKDK
jgi:hypothetical protein